MMKLPSGWRKISLDELAEIQTGVAKNESITGDMIEVPYLRVANVQDGYIDLSELKTIKILRSRLESFRLQEDDVLLTEGGDFDKLGRGAVWSGEINPCVHQNHIFVARPNQSKLIPRFLSQQTGSAYGKKYFLQCSKQSTNLASINSTQLRQFPVILPTLSEQKAIISLLSTWDAAIEKTERLIAAKEKMFKELLNSQIITPTLGNKWKKHNLYNVFEPVSRKNTIGETNILTSSARHGLVSQLKYFKKSVSAEDVSGYYLLKNGEFAYNRSSSNGYPYGAIKRLDEGERGVLSTLYLCMRLKNHIESNSDFYVYVFESGILNRELVLICQEGARSHGLLNLTKEDFYSLQVPTPPRATQDEIAEKLNLARKEITLIEEIVNRYKLQKRGLMQKLLTGEWRIRPEIVRKFEEAQDE